MFCQLLSHDYYYMTLISSVNTIYWAFVPPKLILNSYRKDFIPMLRLSLLFNANEWPLFYKKKKNKKKYLQTKTQKIKVN